MVLKRHIKHSGEEAVRPQKRCKTWSEPYGGLPNIQHPLLSLYYPRVLTLRQFVLSRAAGPAKNRKRKIEAAGIAQKSRSDSCCSSPDFARFLDTTLIGVPADCINESIESVATKYTTFGEKRGTSASKLANGLCSQSEIVDFAVWSLFYSVYPDHVWPPPPHVLCQGYRRTMPPSSSSTAANAQTGSPDLTCAHHNGHIDTLKSNPWNAVLRLLGAKGPTEMLRLIIACSVFVPLTTGHGNYYQLSGPRVTEINLVPSGSKEISIESGPGPSMPNPENKLPSQVSGTLQVSTTVDGTTRSPARITFVRSRMFYSQEKLNCHGNVQLGLRHIHAFRRYSDSESEIHRLRLLQYMFPRQFGLHNVFTSVVDRRLTSQPFMDYTLREEEIRKYEGASSQTLSGQRQARHVLQIPKRLRGRLKELIKKLQILHRRCSYLQLLECCCPLSNYVSKSSDSSNQPSKSLQGPKPEVDECASESISQSKEPFMSYATPHRNVSLFCCAVLSKVIPKAFWGAGDDANGNQRVIFENVDRFLRMTKFGAMTLHEASQGIKISNITWLDSPKVSSGMRMPQGETNKRRELFLEFVYYIYDSIIIPLIRSNFYVTESGVTGNRIFYFRHDVWRFLTEPYLRNIQTFTYEEVRTSTVRRELNGRSLGHCQIRLLPKANGVRLITNLKRREVVKQNGRVTLKQSINKVLAPIHSVLKYECRTQPERLGSSLFSVGDAYSKLKQFKSNLETMGLQNWPLYFAKVDVQACFDTIPQKKALRVISDLLSKPKYLVETHAELKGPPRHTYDNLTDAISKPSCRWQSLAKAEGNFSAFENTLNNELAGTKADAVFADKVVKSKQSRKALMSLLQEHILYNIVKTGKKYFRQRQGIPQGSVLSTYLCNFVYAEMETSFSEFRDHGTSLLLRLTDDFLFISTDQWMAEKFLETIHGGVPEYGITVNPTKSLVNFDAVVVGVKIKRPEDETWFPYIGTRINTKSLSVMKDVKRTQSNDVADLLTIDSSKVPVRIFRRRILNAFEAQIRTILVDSDLNDFSTVVGNVHQAFLSTAIKFYTYLKHLKCKQQPTASILIQIFSDLIEFAFALIRSKSRKEAAHKFRCDLAKTHVRWLAAVAFGTVLKRRQTRFRELLAYIRNVTEQMRLLDSKELKRLPRKWRL